MAPSEEGGSRRTVGLGVFVGTIVILLAVLGFGAYLYNSLSKDYDTLRQDYGVKSQLFENLNQSHTELLSQFNQLNSDYVGLQSDYAEMQRIARLEKTETIFANRVINLEKNGYDGIEFTSQYAGYIDVRISATSSISLLVTNYKYGIVLDYPANGDVFTSASFKMPVLDGTTFLQFFSTSSSTVTVNATLHY